MFELEATRAKRPLVSYVVVVDLFQPFYTIPMHPPLTMHNVVAYYFVGLEILHIMYFIGPNT